MWKLQPIKGLEPATCGSGILLSYPLGDIKCRKEIKPIPRFEPATCGIGNFSSQRIIHGETTWAPGKLSKIWSIRSYVCCLTEEEKKAMNVQSRPTCMAQNTHRTELNLMFWKIVLWYFLVWIIRKRSRCWDLNPFFVDSVDHIRVLSRKNFGLKMQNV